MATYAIGDIQGCYQPFAKLLEKIKFQPGSDKLLLCGDIVNRGPQSLECLRLVRSLGEDAITVLGNHDLSLLALSVGAIEASPKDTFDQVLSAPDCEQLLEWLRQQPLAYMHQDAFFLAHAGLYPWWSPAQALSLAKEVEVQLSGAQYSRFMQHMFGQQPAAWSDDLQGWDRLRFITNALTRMRYCSTEQELDLKAKGSPQKYDGPSTPWFDIENKKLGDHKVIFGHWASLDGKCDTQNIYALDTGCVWGRCLTAYCLESKHKVSVDCS